MSRNEHVDVLIVGAGLAGLGAARQLQENLPGSSYLILEGRAETGGTWDLFRYPGLRSDSDMHTYGYRLAPWTGTEAIASGGDILRYIRDTAEENDIDRHIRVGHRVTEAHWSSETDMWTVTAETGGSAVQITCRFLYLCTGYYNYDQGYVPDFQGLDDFQGEVIHPQHWPEDLDYTGQKVVVIGSGATAVTLVPAMSRRASHVTMLQRSPSYVISIPGSDPLVGPLNRVLGRRLGHAAVRWKNVGIATALYRISRARPGLVRRVLRWAQRRNLPAEYDVDLHFNPSYEPWDQRMCMVPDGDLFRVLSDGSASIVTDRIANFTEHGIRLESGAELEADLVVTATGLNLLAFGGISLTVDGRKVSFSETIAYRGMMLSGVPNFAFTVGYTNGSWTLRADLIAGFVCRLLKHLAENGYSRVAPISDPAVDQGPLLAIDSGYVQRAVDMFPKAGAQAPWQLGTSYTREFREFRRGSIEDGSLIFAVSAGEAAPFRANPVAR